MFLDIHEKETNGFTVCKHEKISLCPRFLGFNHSLQVMIHSQQQVGCHISSQYLDTTARTKEHTDLLPTPWSVYIYVCHKWNQWLTWLILLCSDIRPSLQLFQLAWFCIDHFTWIHDSLNPVCLLNSAALMTLLASQGFHSEVPHTGQVCDVIAVFLKRWPIHLHFLLWRV